MMRQRLLSEANLTFERRIRLCHSSRRLWEGRSYFWSPQRKNMTHGSVINVTMPTNTAELPNGLRSFVTAHTPPEEVNNMRHCIWCHMSVKLLSAVFLLWWLQFGLIGKNFRIKGLKVIRKCNKKNHLAKVCCSQLNSLTRFQFWFVYK